MKSQFLTNGQAPGKRGQLRRLFRAANSNIRQRVLIKPAMKPGPFEAAPQENANHPGHALLTGLLVVYPVFASVAIVLASLWF